MSKLLPLTPGYYWHKSTEGASWQMWHIFDTSDYLPSSLTAYNITQGERVGRYISKWADRWPIGEWRKINPPKP